MHDGTALLERYRESRDPKIKQSLTLLHMALVKRVARGIPRPWIPGIDREDIISCGVIGLMEAIDSYDPAHGVRFEFYAAKRIRGAILDYLRRMDWVPRSVRQKARAIERASSAAEAARAAVVTAGATADSDTTAYTPQTAETSSNRRSRIQDIAAFLHSDVSTVYEWLQDIGRSICVSLDALASPTEADTDCTMYDFLRSPSGPDPADCFQESETEAILAEAVDSLPGREAAVIRAFFYDGLSMGEIADMLHVSESRVTRVRTKAITRLRGRMERLRAQIAV
ncbi:MAG: sigma-70 family RNA polymerase sigma factor [Firmicutes bacterium]|jgi:RNA polymerase sigma factor for flagellar operon FliA|nr:sigma-70 family RNA polymerase sigma factor [Bacillota bacterium]